MPRRELKASFRNGRAFAAYLYLPREANLRVAFTEEVSPGLLLDRDEAGRPMGLEILSLRDLAASVKQIDQILRDADQPPLDEHELDPLLLAA